MGNPPPKKAVLGDAPPNPPSLKEGVGGGTLLLLHLNGGDLGGGRPPQYGLDPPNSQTPAGPFLGEGHETPPNKVGSPPQDDNLGLGGQPRGVPVQKGGGERAEDFGEGRGTLRSSPPPPKASCPPQTPNCPPRVRKWL